VHPELLSNIDAQSFGPPRRDFGRDGGVRRTRRDGPLGGPRLPRPDPEQQR
jgi:hypothetical protein